MLFQQGNMKLRPSFAILGERETEIISAAQKIKLWSCQIWSKLQTGLSWLQVLFPPQVPAGKRDLNWHCIYSLFKALTEPHLNQSFSTTSPSPITTIKPAKHLLEDNTTNKPKSIRSAFLPSDVFLFQLIPNYKDSKLHQLLYLQSIVGFKL